MFSFILDRKVGEMMIFKDIAVVISTLLFVMGSFFTVAKQPLALTNVYLPDYSYAGYEFGEQQPNIEKWQVIDVNQHGLIPNDGLDDTQALQTLLKTLSTKTTPVVLQFSQGQYEISDIIRISRSNIVFRGAGKSATEFYFPRPLIYATTPKELDELAEYLVSLNKVQKEKLKNIHLPFTLWAWSGGFFWTGVEGERVKSYLESYNQNIPALAKLTAGKKDNFSFQVDNAEQLAVGQVVQINWFNPEGEKGSFLQQLYGESEVEIGSHHWNYPKLALSRQQVLITKISKNQVTIKTPLLHDVNSQWNVSISQWQHIKQVGFEHFTMRFPEHQQIAHHVEPGYNGIYLTRTFNGWVKDVVIDNADSAILTESIANVTIDRVKTSGTSLAHYTVQLGGVHNVLVKDLIVENPAIHPLSFNTFANKSVYLNAQVKQQPLLDQHSGANHHNLFDHTQVQVTLTDDSKKYSYPLFAGGGARYWQPQHGSYTTFWNTQINFTNGVLSKEPILLNGMKKGPNARVVGVSANLPIRVEYGPDAYIEGVGDYYEDIPSLYRYQLNKRLNQK